MYEPPTSNQNKNELEDHKSQEEESVDDEFEPVLLYYNIIKFSWHN